MQAAEERQPQTLHCIFFSPLSFLFFFFLRNMVAIMFLFFLYKDQRCSWEQKTRNVSFNIKSAWHDFISCSPDLPDVGVHPGWRQQTECMSSAFRVWGRESQATGVQCFYSCCPPPPFFFSCIVREENPKRKLETSTFPTAISCLPALLHSSRQSAQFSIRNLNKKNL